MRFPRHAERQGIAPESKFAEKKETGPREAGTISEIENCQTCPAFRKGDRIKLGLPGLLQLKAWYSWASKKLLGQASFLSISILISMHFVFMLFQQQIRSNLKSFNLSKDQPTWTTRWNLHCLGAMQTRPTPLPLLSIRNWRNPV